MGHSSIHVTFDTYGHLFPGCGKEASDRYEKSMELARGNSEANVSNPLAIHKPTASESRKRATDLVSCTKETARTAIGGVCPARSIAGVSNSLAIDGRTQGKIGCELLKRLVAGVGFEPTTFGS
jgi:hypothetical protein